MTTYEQLKSQPFTEEEKARWAEMMHYTWAAIAGDIEEGMRLCRQRLTRPLIVEAVCDANRMEQYGDLTRDEAKFLSAIYSQPRFQKWARKQMNYV